ncbi:hypothetical protein F0562_025150 [Nyssa sinensis]|uniref:HD-Zip IV C-terminal domain-containing protein n=1 Tax=Nyssa sinensis TaxID=561372 RepID=A0A5J5BDT1_9ASTE|nr:hypothetical protein F0562_025150 [Nyssa sinensis]
MFITAALSLTSFSQAGFLPNMQWDIMSNGGPVQSIANLAEGQDRGNAVTIREALRFLLRERDNSKAERAQHLKQIHDLTCKNIFKKKRGNSWSCRNRILAWVR